MFEKILVAVDESEHARPVLEAAAAFATSLQAEVRVLHVLESAFVGRAGMVSYESSDAAHHAVTEAIAALDARGIKASGVVRSALHGRLALEINEESTEYGAGMVIMGSRGLTDLEGIFIGSTSHRLLHVSKIPVLVVP